MEQNHVTGTATILYPNMGEINALDLLARVKSVLSNLVLWLENGQSGQTGQTVVKRVM